MRTNTTAAGLIRLQHPAATDPSITGAKAANLAQAALAGLPVLPGVVLTTASAATIAADGLFPAQEAALRAAWTTISNRGSRSLVVRSSAVAEDSASSSMAGLFDSVLDVRTWPAFLSAVKQVIASADTIPDTFATNGAAGAQAGPSSTAVAVLVQPYLKAPVGGVLFGVDPVSGRTDRLVVAAAAGGPHHLVGGEATGATHLLTRHGRTLKAEGDPASRLEPRHLRALARLHARSARTFGGPQDIEWALDRDGDLHLLQSRPVTATGQAARRGPVLGPGPVAETFPAPLEPLEEDLWLVPMRAGITAALDLTGAVSRRRLASSPVVTAVGGRVAADLELLGAVPAARSLLSRLDPRPAARRLAAAWRVGRLRAALPRMAAQLVRDADAALAQLPPAGRLDDAELVSALRWSRAALAAVHGQEVLAGALLDHHDQERTAAALALEALAHARAAGLDEHEVAAREPVVLALTPPAVRPQTPLPAGWSQTPAKQRADTTAASPVNAPAGGGTTRLEDLPPREALRLRARWLQELGSVLAWEAGVRLTRAGGLGAPGQVRGLRLEELAAAAHNGFAAPNPADRTYDRTHAGTEGANGTPAEAGLTDGGGASGLLTRPTSRAGAPLPAAFRLAADGTVVAVGGGDHGRAQGAGGGRAAGRVHTGPDAPPAGAVLVVRTLDPDLAQWLPRLSGLVAETGSVLSHLAILARELHVPTVVGVAGALERFPQGAQVVVDGTSGEVALAEDAEMERAA